MGAGIARRDRLSCDYEAYIPDMLAGRLIVLSSQTATDVADAEKAIALLDAEAALADTEALARILLRAESVASSRIEGLEVGARRLLRAEAAIQLGAETSDVTATEVLSNIKAMAAAIGRITPGEPITLELLLNFHRQLLAGTRLDTHARTIREAQNWIGGSSYNPCSAAFVPPPPEHVAGLLEDLCRFCNTDDIPAVAQAAIAHAQFETIHPFVDGNGRTGRALIHLVLRRRGLATRVLPPVSLVLETWADDYVLGLDASRYRGPANSAAARDGTDLWIGRFAAACSRAVRDAASFGERARQLQQSWRAQLGPVRDVGRRAGLELARGPQSAHWITSQHAKIRHGRQSDGGQPSHLGRGPRRLRPSRRRACRPVDHDHPGQREISGPDERARRSTEPGALLWYT